MAPSCVLRLSRLPSSTARPVVFNSLLRSAHVLVAAPMSGAADTSISGRSAVALIGQDAAPAAKRRRLNSPPQSAQQVAVSTATAPKATAKTAAQPQQNDDHGVWLIVGLGNPGSTYDNTRHNIGFAVIEELAKQEGIDCRKLEKSAALGKGVIEGKQVLLCKPVTFMNNSGESVAALAKFYRVPSRRVLVISDDLDLPVAEVRLRQKGGHGGHNGLRSIIERMGNTQDFPRIKIGIGRPSGPIPVPSYVLQPFSRAEQPDMERAVVESIGVVRSILRLGLEKAASGQRV